MVDQEKLAACTDPIEDEVSVGLTYNEGGVEADTGKDGEHEGETR